MAENVHRFVREDYGKDAPAIVFHPQCFRESGHFAGSDAGRAAAFVEMANDPDIDALWFARGGYGACRIVETAFGQLDAAAGEKTYMGYSDAGFLLARLYKDGIGTVAHGPMPADILRQGGKVALKRALDYLAQSRSGPATPAGRTGAGSIAFNMSVLAHLTGTPWLPDMAGHVLMLEEVSEHLYAIDRALFTITSAPAVRQVAGIRLGRCSDVPENDIAFGYGAEEIMEYWCARSAIPYLGRADIGHDADNKVIEYGS